LTFAVFRDSMIAMKHVQQTVAEIDAARRQYFERSPDRPQGRVRARSRKPAEVVKAESRMRTAAWRDSLDKLGRPESDTVALQFLVSLIEVAREAGKEVADLPETQSAFDRMFAVMTERGFQRSEVEAVIRRITRRSR
jgi:hypothetical protein